MAHWLKLAVFGTVLVLFTTCDAFAGDGLPLVGVIRWDAWFRGSDFAAQISTPTWRTRLPFYSESAADGTITIDDTSPDTTTKEVRLAAAAGINYFIFGLYVDKNPDGSAINSRIHFTDPMRNFVQIGNKRGLKFSFFLPIATDYQNRPRLRQLVKEFITDSSFLTTDNGRSVLFIFMPTAQHWTSSMKDVSIYQKIISDLRGDVKQSTNHDPYLVGLNFYPDLSETLIKTIGLDAISSYGNPLGQRPIEQSSGQQSFKMCAQASQWYWKESEMSHISYLPPVSLGWDYRPLIDDKDRNKDPEWCEQPTTEEVKLVVFEALQKARQQVFPSIVIYAWNEFSEGGFLAPTLCEGAAKLRGLSEATGSVSRFKKVLAELHVTASTTPCAIVPPVSRP